MLASTPYMDEAEQFDRVALLSEGARREGMPAEIRASVPGVVLELVRSGPSRRPVAWKGPQASVSSSSETVRTSSPPRTRSCARPWISARQAGLQVQRLRSCLSIEDVFLRLMT